jgi:DNA-binding SARP family transcriptional activator/predicted ATPase
MAVDIGAEPEMGDCLAAALRIELLGQFRITYAGQQVSGIHARQQELLTYMILNRRRRLSRQQIAGLFWPESNDSQALTNLRRELHNLRRSLPHADRFLLIEPGDLGWRDESSFTCDVYDFEAATEQGGLENLERAAQLYQGDLLPACYQDWIAPQRERLSEKVVDGLKRLTAAREDQCGYADAIRYARRLITLDPLDEEAYRTLMRLHALQGDRAAALQAYLTCATVLRRELGVDPTPTTRAAYERLLASEELPTPQSARTTAPPLIGRHAEWARLLAAWQHSARGRAQLALIRGEAGIGKTRLAEELAEWCTQQGIAAATARSYAIEGRLAYGPVTDWLRSRAVRPALWKLDEVWISEVARLLPELTRERRDLPTPAPLTEGWQRQRLFEALAQTLLRASQPLLLVLDDLQWCDPDTLGLLHYILRTHPDARLLVVGTLRTEEASESPGVSELVSNLRHLDRFLEIDLSALDETATAALVAHAAGRSVDPKTVERLFRRTEGHPLFVLEMARADLRGAASLPPKIQSFIATRLGRLSEPAQEIVRLAATVGRDFSFDALREASDLEEKSLVMAVDELCRHRVVRQRAGPEYDFSHDLVRDVAYDGISPTTARLLHGRVAQALELVHAPDLDRVSAQVATHYDRAGNMVKAIHFYRRAAKLAGRVLASEEAIRQSPHGRERDREELAMQLALAAPLNAARGYPSAELEAALQRARELGQGLGDTGAVVQSLAGLFTVHFVRGNIHRSFEIGTEALKLGAAHAPLLPMSHYAVAGALASLGELARARDHFARAMAQYEPQQSHPVLPGLDVLVFSSAWSAHVCWLLGHPDQAIQQAQQAISEAQQLALPHSLTMAHAYAGLVRQFRRDRVASKAHAESAMDLCSKYGFAYYREWGTIVQGWAVSKERPQEGVAMIRQGLANLRGLGAEARRPYYLSLLAEGLLHAGQQDEARAVVDAALATAAQNRDVWWLADLHRLRGVLSDDSEEWFERALEIARSQASKSLELRVAVSLGRVWKDRGAAARARALVAPVYEWFTEGFQTADLVEAQTLLADL